jgi:hypothetical protein
MLFEGLIVMSRRALPDLIVAILAVVTYLFSVVSVFHVLFTGHLWYRPLLFHISVIMLAAWTGWQWFRWSRRTAV